jgi:manganese/iron transport system permease protein
MHYLTDPLHYQFMQRALAAAALTGLACGVLGSYVVLRGLAFMGDALTHAVFPGIAIAVAVGRSILAGALVVGLLTATGIAAISRGRRVSEDTAIGILFAAMFALGVVIVTSSPSYAKDVFDLLFGDILAVDRADLELTAVSAAVAVGATLLLQKELALVGFDRDMARAMRYPVFLLDLVLLWLITLAIVVSLQAIGPIMVLAMLVTPAATARLVTDRLAVMQAVSAAIGVAAGVIGLYISFWWNVASGGAVVLTATGIFFAVFTVVQARERLQRAAAASA